MRKKSFGIAALTSNYRNFVRSGEDKMEDNRRTVEMINMADFFEILKKRH